MASSQELTPRHSEIVARKVNGEPQPRVLFDFFHNRRVCQRLLKAQRACLGIRRESAKQHGMSLHSNFLLVVCGRHVPGKQVPSTRRRIAPAAPRVVVRPIIVQLFGSAHDQLENFGVLRLAV